MKISFYILLSICSIIYSCKSKKVQEENAIDNQENNYSEEQFLPTPENIFLTNSDVEVLIQANNPQFLSAFWVGMTKGESIEIIRYLLEKKELSGLIYNFSSLDYEELGIEKLKNPDFDQDRILLHCLLTPKVKTLKCGLDLSFNSENGDTILESIRVSAINQVNLRDFENFVGLYEKKYGRPTEAIKTKPKNSIIPTGDIYRNYSFKKDNTIITISYSSEHETEGLVSPDQIHILYENSLILEQQTKALEKKVNEFKQEKKREQEKTLEKI